MWKFKDSAEPACHSLALGELALLLAAGEQTLPLRRKLAPALKKDGPTPHLGSSLELAVQDIGKLALRTPPHLHLPCGGLGE